MSHQRKISVTGLGYVGLTIAVAFGRKAKVIGFDINQVRISELKKSFDSNNEIPAEQLKKAQIHYTGDPTALKEADFHIIAVPTPLNEKKHPDLSTLLKATETIGKQLKRGDVVVYESTVYPGVTEEQCIPVLEKASGLACGKDFSVGYSPERINPGDKVHTLENIIKVVSANDNKALEQIAAVYGHIVKGVHRVSSIKVAEATKILENTQRDINISLMNEVALILHACNMEISEVIDAAKTKWNFMPFKPGLVGGHCIGINSYYLAHKALEVGFFPNLIFAGQAVNENMIQYLAQEAIRQLNLLNISPENARVAVLGITYKEDYSDFHDSKILDLIKLLEVNSLKVLVHDPLANVELVKKECKIDLIKWEDLIDLDAILLVVGHQFYRELKMSTFKKMLKANALLMDVKGILDDSKVPAGVHFWKI